MLTYLIDDIEHRHVATMDIPGSSMQADTEGETVHIKLEGKMVYIFTKMDPKLYQKYTQT